MLYQKRDIVPTFSQWRHRNNVPGKPEKEILPKRATLNFTGKLGIGCGDDSNVDTDRPTSADRNNLMVFQDPQKLALKTNWHVPNFVKEHSPTIRHFKPSLAITSGSGKSSADMTEQHRFSQLEWNRDAVDCYKRCRGP